MSPSSSQPIGSGQMACVLRLICLRVSCTCFQEAKCAYALALMAVYWLTEALPLPVTALLPVVLFPLLGVMPVAAVCKNYIKVCILFIQHSEHYSELRNVMLPFLNKHKMKCVFVF